MVKKCLYCGGNTLNTNRMCDKCKEDRQCEAAISLYSDFKEDTGEKDVVVEYAEAKRRYKKNTKRMTPAKLLGTVVITMFSCVALSVIGYMLLLVTNPVKADMLVAKLNLPEINLIRKESDSDFKKSCKAYAIDTLVSKSSKYEGTRIYITGLAETTGEFNSSTGEYKFKLIVDKTQGIKDYNTSGLDDIKNQIDRAAKELGDTLGQAASGASSSDSTHKSDSTRPIVYISYVGDITESLLDGAMVNIYGTFQGMYSYTESGGAVITVPIIKARIVEYS